MPLGFRKMNYPYMLYETLRNYYSVNTAGNLSYLFKYMACFIQPLIAPFDTYDIFRQTAWLVAQCAWQVGQLTNVLNYLYDPTLKRIYINQATNDSVFATCFGQTALINVPEFGQTTPVGLEVFGAPPLISAATFNVPTALSSILSQITATIAQVAPAGISYTIQLF